MPAKTDAVFGVASGERVGMGDRAHRLVETEKVTLPELLKHACEAFMIHIGCARDFRDPRWSTEPRKELQHALPHEIFRLAERRRPFLDQAGARTASSAQRFACGRQGHDGPVRAPATRAQL